MTNLNPCQQYNKVQVELAWARYRQGEAQAYDLLYHYYFERLCRFSQKQLNDIHIAKNIAAEVLVKLYQHPAPQSIKRLEQWLYKVAHNLCISHLRKSKTKRSLMSFLKFSFRSKQAYNGVETTLHKLDMEQAYQVLSSKEKAVLRWAAKGYSAAEIAQMNDCAPKTISNQLAIARKKLRAVL